jgi:hypothetical protein
MEKIRGNNLRLDLSDLEQLSREVGYYNKCANIKHLDENGDEYYDEEDIHKYEELRTKQLDMIQQMIESYS